MLHVCVGGGGGRGVHVIWGGGGACVMDAWAYMCLNGARSMCVWGGGACAFVHVCGEGGGGGEYISMCSCNRIMDKCKRLTLDGSFLP